MGNELVNTQSDWPWPGSRWWKFDFHTHTPASKDTTAWQRAIGTPDELSPERWLLKYMEANIDCVVVTDHNSGDWIDRLKAAYGEMKQQVENGNPTEGFRELTLFPGVELSVNGGIHLLAIFDPSAATRTITDLLAAVRYHGSDGESDGVTRENPADVVKIVLDKGGIPIPAHADRDKGLLRVNPGTRQSALDANTVHQIVDVEDLLAVEWLDMSMPTPECVEKQVTRFARVLGSDCHSFQGDAVPGSRYTWIKMASPTIEGLRLALLDGNGISVRRSDEGDFEPFETPAHFITGIEVKNARFMGNGGSEQLAFTPYYNALIGGRGTGKSTIVHALRLIYRRDVDLDRLSVDSDPYQQFSRFCKVVSGRDGEGALRENTEIRLEMMRDGVAHKLRWRRDGQGVVVEERGTDSQWVSSPSQTINAERFPIRIFSQGQIAAMAGDNRQALLDVIDEAANIGEKHRAFEEAKRTWFTQQARLRELDGRLKERLELERKLADVVQKLKAFAQSGHAEILKSHQQALRQRREIDGTLEQLQILPGRIESLKQEILLDDLPDDIFDPLQDDDVLKWRSGVEQSLAAVRKALESLAQELTDKAQALSKDERLLQWRQRADKAQADYKELQARLAEQGVTGPQDFEQLEQQRQRLEGQLKVLARVQEDQEQLKSESEAQFQHVINARKAITEAREVFVGDILETNEFVRMEVVPFGFDARTIERSLRELLDIQDGRFENDILLFKDGEPASGLAFEFSAADDRDAALERVTAQLKDNDEGLGGHFRNYLKRKFDKPEFADHVSCWFPEDDLRIEYNRNGSWIPIAQGSQGQRSAALLAFLLAFGDEPLILDQPEDDLDNHLIYELIVRQIRENKLRRQLIIVTHNPNVVVNGDAEMVHAFDFCGGQCRNVERGALQEVSVRDEVCRVMEGGLEAFSRRWARLGKRV